MITSPCQSLRFKPESVINILCQTRLEMMILITALKPHLAGLVNGHRGKK